MDKPQFSTVFFSLVHGKIWKNMENMEKYTVQHNQEQSTQAMVPW
jgi:uncharacterized membrane protein